MVDLHLAQPHRGHVGRGEGRPAGHALDRDTHLVVGDRQDRVVQVGGGSEQSAADRSRRLARQVLDVPVRGPPGSGTSGTGWPSTVPRSAPASPRR